MSKYKNCGEVLKALREELDLTQIDLAHRCRCHSQFVSNWERGICLPPSLEMNRMLNALPARRVTEFIKMLTDAYADDMRIALTHRMGW